MLEPIVRTIEVPCSQEKAFNVFVSQMPGWWPLDQRSVSMFSGAAAKALRVDARSGGQIVEIGHDDTEHLWGTIRSYDPYAFVSLDFHMAMPAENASLVEVRFTALAADRTRVQLKQSNFEAFGDMAEMNHQGYGSSWIMLFDEKYGAACAA